MNGEPHEIECQVNSYQMADSCQTDACQADSRLSAEPCRAEPLTTDGYPAEALVSSGNKAPVPDFSEYGRSYANGQDAALVTDAATNIAYGGRNVSSTTVNGKQEWYNNVPSVQLKLFLRRHL